MIQLDASRLAANFFSLANFTLRTIRNASGSPTLAYARQLL
jgi:hypothetical protein